MVFVSNVLRECLSTWVIIFVPSGMELPIVNGQEGCGEGLGHNKAEVNKV